MRHNDIDPITLEVVRNRLDAIAQEMQDALVRSAFSNIIKEGHDCSAALFDADANIVAQATALPAQLGVLPTAVHKVVERFASEQVREGDIFVLNDPYDGGTHLPDIALIAPVIIQGAAVAFAACIAHHQDVGGKTPGSLPTDATDIFQEGLRIPPLRLYEGGAPNATAHAFIERNVRIPEIVLGDLRAQRAALHVGTTRLATLFAEHGGDRMALLMTELLDRSERLTRNAIANMRPGTYVFEDYLDDDGIDRENLVRIRASVTISGSDMTIGFDGSSPQLKGPLNADRSAVLSAVYFVLKAITIGCNTVSWASPAQGSLAPLNSASPTYLAPSVAVDTPVTVTVTASRDSLQHQFGQRHDHCQGRQSAGGLARGGHLAVLGGAGDLHGQRIGSQYPGHRAVDVQRGPGRSAGSDQRHCDPGIPDLGDGHVQRAHPAGGSDDERLGHSHHHGQEHRRSRRAGLGSRHGDGHREPAA